MHIETTIHGFSKTSDQLWYVSDETICFVMKHILEKNLSLINFPEIANRCDLIVMDEEHAFDAQKEFLSLEIDDEEMKASFEIFFRMTKTEGCRYNYLIFIFFPFGSIYLGMHAGEIKGGKPLPLEIVCKDTCAKIIERVNTKLENKRKNNNTNKDRNDEKLH